MVLFITGICGRTCWYCPLSSGRKGKDFVYANERQVETPEEAIEVARRMSALGTGITGGEPLLRLDRVISYCRELKKEFSPDHQIHLYTGIAPGREDLEAMTGLVDEIRLHPPRNCWEAISESKYVESAAIAKELGFDVGIEVPSLRGIEHLAAALPSLDFLNINELEWGETNAEAMRSRGHLLADGVHNAVKGARGWAGPLLGEQKVHWCSSSFKDSVQLRKRLIRIARNTARSFDEVTKDGTILYGVLEGQGDAPPLIRELGNDMFEIRDGQLETAWWVITRYAKDLPGRKSILERYPDRGLIVEVTPV
ncbi:MAG: 4Fe-4S cluster-binding domain-containing protein [Methanolinea sp.]|nr:4Fe-4S cluster-binding domain-containing protein [Methanolinea sp.]